MKTWIALAISFVGVSADLSAAQIPPVPENPMRAQTFLGFNIQTRCPGMRFADAGPRVEIVFWVARRGTQSQISVKKSSGSAELDAASIDCVSKIRFAPATTLGDGEPVDSWQQTALGWADEAGAVAPKTPSSKSAAGSPTASMAESGGQVNTVAVHVCVDENGKLKQDPAIVHSSGVDALDQAALKIAAAGSPYYRPPTTSSSLSTSGCAQLAIKFDAK